MLNKYAQLIDKDGCVVITGKVKVIPENAFLNGESLKRIVLPDSLTEIREFAFMGCENLVEVVFPSSLSAIGNDAFRKCKSLSSITIPDSVSEIGSRCFEGCENLKEVQLPASLSVIGDSVFDGCKSLSSITIPDSVTKIGSSCFKNCQNLKTARLSKGLEEIGWRAFENCASLETIIIPDSVKEIGAYSFCGCSSLSDLSVPEGVTEISSRSFRGCGSISVHLPSSLCSIHNDLVSYADVKDVSISSENEALSVDSHCLVDKKSRALLLISRSATTWPDNISSVILPEAFLPPFVDVEELAIPDGVQYVGMLPYEKLTKLKRLTLPASMTSCGKSFMNGYPFSSISVSPELLLCENFGSWQEISKVELIGVDSVDAGLLDKIKAKYKKDKSLCVYLHGQAVYPASHIVKKKEEAIAARLKTIQEQESEYATLTSLCASTFEPSGFEYLYSKQDDDLTVIIRDSFQIFHSLTPENARDVLPFVLEVASAYREALKEFVNSTEQSSVYCRFSFSSPGNNDFYVGLPLPGSETDVRDYLILCPTPGSCSPGLHALRRVFDAQRRLVQEYGDRMNGITFHRRAEY